MNESKISEAIKEQMRVFDVMRCQTILWQTAVEALLITHPDRNRVREIFERNSAEILPKLSGVHPDAKNTYMGVRNSILERLQSEH